MTKFTDKSILLIFWILLIIILILIYITLHPIIIILILLIYTITLSINISIWNPNYLYSIILFLIIIRGLIIIFLYFSRLISNEKINYPNKIFILIIIYIRWTITPITKFIYRYIIKYISLESNQIIKLNFNLFNNIINLYEYPYNHLTLMRITFLILYFFLIIKICSYKSLPIRKLNYDKTQ